MSIHIQIIRASKPKHYDILCVGDSITRGRLSSDVKKYSYPARLQQILESKLANVTFNVFNAGQGGTTALKNTSNSYWNTEIYRHTLSVARVYSILIFQFGTNDAVHNKIADNTTFIKDYKTLVQTFTDSNPRLQVFLSIPPPIYLTPSVHYPHSNIANYSFDMLVRLPRIIKSIGYEMKHHLIDVFNALGGKELTKRECITEDGIHPNDLGYNLIAETVAARLYPFLI